MTEPMSAGEIDCRIELMRMTKDRDDCREALVGLLAERGGVEARRDVLAGEIGQIIDEADSRHILVSLMFLDRVRAALAEKPR